jgi:malate dehydrogenase (oxaloacetate-decarboxylating)
VTEKRFEDLNIVVSGAGAAGFAITRMLRCIGYNPDLCSRVHDIIVCDSKGIIHRDREGLYANKYKYIIAGQTNRQGRTGTLEDAMEGADVCIGVSVPAIITPAMVRSMNHDPVIFALANPVPEILPHDAQLAGAAIVGTGRAEYPNQINYALAFPGIFRGALDARATRISDEMKVAAAHALADYVPHPQKNHILPRVLDRDVVAAVATAVHAAAVSSGCARSPG